MQLGVSGVEPATVGLWDAVDGEDAPAARRCVADGATVSAANRMGITALHRAAAAGSCAMVALLARELGAALDRPDRVGTTPLGMAAGRGHTAAVRLLLELGADASAPREDGARALHLACAGGHVAAALALVRAAGAAAAGAGAADKEGFLPLHHLEQTSAERNAPAEYAELARALGAAGEAPGAPPPSGPPPSPPPSSPPVSPLRLSAREGRRYSRHLLLAEVGVAGQLRLKGARVLVVGAGGLGSPALLYLAAAGVGRIALVDDDAVDESNLQRQVLHSVATLGRPKVESACEALRALNPHVALQPIRARLDRSNARALVGRADVVLDCTDALGSRYVVADACAAERVPLVYGAVSQFEGHVATFRYDAAPLDAGPRPAGYRDLYPKRPPAGAVANCAAAGVIGVLPAVVGSLQATEALKLLLGQGRTLDGRLLVYNALDLSFIELPVGTRADLPRDGEGLWALGGREEEAEAAAAASSGIGGPTEEEASVRLISPLDASARMAAGWAPFLLDVRSAREAAISQIGGTHLRWPHDELGAPGALGALPASGEVLIYCRSGARSLAACAELARSGGVGAERLFSLEGGVNAWAADVDASLLQY